MSREARGNLRLGVMAVGLFGFLAGLFCGSLGATRIGALLVLIMWPIGFAGAVWELTARGRGTA